MTATGEHRVAQWLGWYFGCYYWSVVCILSLKGWDVKETLWCRISRGCYTYEHCYPCDGLWKLGFDCFSYDFQLRALNARPTMHELPFQAGAVKQYIKMLLQCSSFKFLVFAHHLVMLKACTEAVVENKVGTCTHRGKLYTFLNEGARRRSVITRTPFNNRGNPQYRWFLPITGNQFCSHHWVPPKRVPLLWKTTSTPAPTPMPSMGLDMW